MKRLIILSVTGLSCALAGCSKGSSGNSSLNDNLVGMWRSECHNDNGGGSSNDNQTFTREGKEYSEVVHFSRPNCSGTTRIDDAVIYRLKVTGEDNSVSGTIELTQDGADTKEDEVQSSTLSISVNGDDLKMKCKGMVIKKSGHLIRSDDECARIPLARYTRVKNMVANNEL